MRPTLFYTVVRNSYYLSSFTVVEVTEVSGSRVWGRKIAAYGLGSPFDISLDINLTYGKFDTLEEAEGAADRLRETGRVWQDGINRLEDRKQADRLQCKKQLRRLYPSLAEGETA